MHYREGWSRGQAISDPFHFAAKRPPADLVSPSSGLAILRRVLSSVPRRREYQAKLRPGGTLLRILMC
jgi:hypothetical protein